MNEQQVTIFLTPLQAEQFVQFQKNHVMFALLQSNKVFDIRYGKATLNFADGVLQNITKEEIVWHK